MRFREIFIEGVAETQDVLAISRSVIDYVIMNKDRFLKPVKDANGISSNVIDLKDIPNLPKPTTAAGQTLIDSTRIKIVDPEILKRRATPGSRIGGDAAPYYTDAKGEYQGRAYPDARMNRDPNVLKNTPDIISDKASRGNKLDIRLNAELLDVKSERQLQSTLTHELSHHLDTIKGMNTIQDQDNFSARINDEERLARHKQHVELKAKGLPYNDQWILPPKEEKQLIGRLRKPVPEVPATGTKGYYADVSELNARLMQTAETIAEQPEALAEWLKGNRIKLDTVIRDALSHHSIPQAFISYKSEAEFKAALRKAVTQEEWTQALKNPEFQQLYKRIYKFVSDESQLGGTIAQAGKDGFKTWATNVKYKQSFIGRFKQVVINGIELAKDTAKLVYRKFVMTDQILTQLIMKRAPEWVAQAGFKSIPFVGLALGIGFGIPRLIKGDYTGAGLEVASGVGSLLTVIPTTAYLIARDLYSEAYDDEDGNPANFEADMINDPEGTKQRVEDLANRIATTLRTLITQNASKYPQAFQTTQGGAAVGNPKLAQQAMTARTKQ